MDNQLTQQTLCYQRILGSQTAHFEAQRVGFIGKVEQLDGNQLQLIVNPQTQERVHINWTEQLQELPPYLEVRGYVNQGLFEVEEYTQILQEFDLDMYNQFVTLTQDAQFAPMFTPTQQ